MEQAIGGVMFMLRLSSAAIGCVCLAGCGLHPVEVANPDAITLRHAVFDVVDTLHDVRDKYQNSHRIGLYPSEATVTFNISSQSTETSGLQVGATIPATISPVPVSITGSDQIVGVGSRGNQIAITFKNVLDLPAAGGADKGGGAAAVKKKEAGAQPAAPGQQAAAPGAPAPLDRLKTCDDPDLKKRDPICFIVMSAPYEAHLSDTDKQKFQALTGKPARQ